MISPAVTPALRELAENGVIEWQLRAHIKMAIWLARAWFHRDRPSAL